MSNSTPRIHKGELLETSDKIMLCYVMLHDVVVSIS